MLGVNRKLCVNSNLMRKKKLKRKTGCLCVRFMLRVRFSLCVRFLRERFTNQIFHTYPSEKEIPSRSIPQTYPS